jgi:hypothetical protein
VTEGAASHGLIIRLIIQTIRQDPSGAVWTDEAPNVSRPDRSGADQIDAEHQSTDLAVGGSNPSRRANAPGQKLCSRIPGPDRSPVQTDLVGSSPVWWMIRSAAGQGVSLAPRVVSRYAADDT